MKKLPIAEYFHSIQGEGVYTGTPMLFIRTAGCNVGGDPVYGPCYTFDGRTFTCDTDYKKKLESTIGDLIFQERFEKHICITGGEPFLHDLDEVTQIHDKSFHFETSGTLPLPEWLSLLPASRCWCACSPKRGFLPQNRDLIDEWKFLVDENFPFNDPEGAIFRIIGDSVAPVFLQPINEIHSLNKTHLGLCQDLLRKYPHWRLSLQTHKLIGLR